MKPNAHLSDTGRLLFGAGFVFGVTATIVMLSIVTVTVTGSPGPLLATFGAGIVFTTIIGGSLFLLAFPENRPRLPLGSPSAGVDEERVAGEEAGDS